MSKPKYLRLSFPSATTTSYTQNQSNIQIMKTQSTAGQVIFDALHPNTIQWPSISAKYNKVAAAVLNEPINIIRELLQASLSSNMNELYDARANAREFLELNDVYAELRAAHAAGKTIQRWWESTNDWQDILSPTFSEPVETYRIKPWELSRHINGFRALAEHEKWHFADKWTENDLPPGMRPLLEGEDEQEGDQFKSMCGWTTNIPGTPLYPSAQMELPRRTTRPLPPLASPIEVDKWNKWSGGAVCPVAPSTTVDVKFANGSIENNMNAGFWNWEHDAYDHEGNIVAYRVVGPEETRLRAIEQEIAEIRAKR